MDRVEFMTEMASGASLLDFDATLWDVSKVRDMSDMFKDAVSFVGGDGISTWNVMSVTNVDEMFQGATSLISDGVMSWNLTSVYTRGSILEQVLEHFESLQTRVLNIPNLEMQGTIPDTFVSDRTEVVDLYLVQNNLTGSLPTDLVNMQNLRRVFVSENTLEGSLVIPSNAVEFQGSDNFFQGEITTDMVQDALEILILSRNEFSGSTTTSWLNRGTLNLNHVALDHNLLSGTLSLDAMSAISILDLSSNLFTGSLPLTLPATIRVLKLSDNAFGGTSWFQNVQSVSLLEELDLSRNDLSGTIQSLAFAALDTFIADDNRLNGVLPADIPTTVKVLSIRNNALSGPIRDIVATLTSLTNLRLDHNDLTGPIHLSDSHVEVLLNHNQLDGTLSQDFFTANSNLQTLYLHHNRLTGPVPATMNLAAELEHLRMDENEFTGTLPTLETLTKLKELRMDRNSLTGPLPSGLSTMLDLVHLDLANNGFTGTFSSVVFERGVRAWCSSVVFENVNRITRS